MLGIFSGVGDPTLDHPNGPRSSAGDPESHKNKNVARMGHPAENAKDDFFTRKSPDLAVRAFALCRAGAMSAGANGLNYLKTVKLRVVDCVFPPPVPVILIG